MVASRFGLYHGDAFIGPDAIPLPAGAADFRDTIRR
jgi:hypothetical protein